MSIIRRVKSFSIKKYRSTDELSSNIPYRPNPRNRQKTLTRERSASMENVPLHIELEKSDLFIKQREKTQQEEEKNTILEIPKREFKKAPLKKRKSVSFDEVQFSRCINEFSEEVNLRKSVRKRDKSRYNTVDVVKDLITNCTNEQNTVDSVNKPGTFPLTEEEHVDVVIRTSNRNAKPGRPKTYASTLTKKKEDILEFKGVSRLEIGRELCVKIRTKETLRLIDGSLELLDEKFNSKEIYTRNVTLKKTVKMINKTELEIVDTNRIIYRLQFPSTKEAKYCFELIKTYYSEPSPLKNIGPWSQLRKLLKKRSSRDFLESKGIIKNEPIFGNTLEELCDTENSVPEVVTRIVELIEDHQNITSVGLYRASANLAVVQNIRFEINCGRWDILEKHKSDVDVLAGTLKLFFRELKNPLISCEVYAQLHRVIFQDHSNEIGPIIDRLPPPNRSTFLFIIQHLLKVCQHKNENKMDFHNISICWGPSLITLPENCIDLVTQTTEFTRITENLLMYYSENSPVLEKIEVPVKPTDFIYDVVRKLTEIIEANIEVEGIYRKSGSNSKIDKIMKQLEKKNLSEVDGKYDIHDLCCVLKKYLASIRKSIVSDDFFHTYCEICDKVEDSILIRDRVRSMIDSLPRKDVLTLLFTHLQKVALNDQKNKMSISILSDIWMTTLLAGANVQNYKKKMPKYNKLFLILMNLNEKNLPDLVTDPRNRLWSKYDNVPDDIHNEVETGSSDKVSTKL